MSELELSMAEVLTGLINPLHLHPDRVWGLTTHQPTTPLKWSAPVECRVKCNFVCYLWNFNHYNRTHIHHIQYWWYSRTLVGHTCTCREWKVIPKTNSRTLDGSKTCVVYACLCNRQHSNANVNYPFLLSWDGCVGWSLKLDGIRQAQASNEVGHEGERF